MRKKYRKAAIILFTVYAVCMFILLFARSRDNPNLSYWVQVQHRTALIPFKTTTLFVKAILSGAPRLVWIGLSNLLGNILLFIPLGFFQPVIWEKQNSLRKVMRTTLFTICTVEISQLFLMVGTCDIDDLMLNMLGAFIGYGIYKLAQKIAMRRGK